MSSLPYKPCLFFTAFSENAGGGGRLRASPLIYRLVFGSCAGARPCYTPRLLQLENQCTALTLGITRSLTVEVVGRSATRGQPLELYPCRLGKMSPKQPLWITASYIKSTGDHAPPLPQPQAFNHCHHLPVSRGLLREAVPAQGGTQNTDRARATAVVVAGDTGGETSMPLHTTHPSSGC